MESFDVVLLISILILIVYAKRSYESFETYINIPFYAGR